MSKLYDTIGLNYANLRTPDERIAERIEAALGNAQTVLSVGAGAGSYEPPGKIITAVEPSARMIQQRPVSNATVIQGSAEALPFEDNAFDASMAVLTIHPWSNQEKGVMQMRRVTRDKVVFLTYDASFPGFWLADYFPALVTLDEAQMPDMASFEQWLGVVNISPILIPHNCSDGFLAAYWRRPAAYLEESVRAAISSFWALGDISAGLEKLDADLKSGVWEQRYSDLLNLEALDCGYRLVDTT